MILIPTLSAFDTASHFNCPFFLTGYCVFFDCSSFPLLLYLDVSRLHTVSSSFLCSSLSLWPWFELLFPQWYQICPSTSDYSHSLQSQISSSFSAFSSWVSHCHFKLNPFYTFLLIPLLSPFSISIDTTIHLFPWPGSLNVIIDSSIFLPTFLVLH